MGEDTVFESVRDLVAAGDYRDRREVETPRGLASRCYRQGAVAE